MPLTRRRRSRRATSTAEAPHRRGLKRKKRRGTGTSRPVEAAARRLDGAHSPRGRRARHRRRNPPAPASHRSAAVPRPEPRKLTAPAPPGPRTPAARRRPAHGSPNEILPVPAPRSPVAGAGPRHERRSPASRSSSAGPPRPTPASRSPRPLRIATAARTVRGREASRDGEHRRAIRTGQTRSGTAARRNHPAGLWIAPAVGRPTQMFPERRPYAPQNISMGRISPTERTSVTSGNRKTSRRGGHHGPSARSALPREYGPTRPASVASHKTAADAGLTRTQYARSVRLVVEELQRDRPRCR